MILLSINKKCEKSSQNDRFRVSQMLNPTQPELISFGRLKLLSRYIRYLEGNLDETEYTQCDNPLFYQLHQILMNFVEISITTEYFIIHNYNLVIFKI